MKLLIVYATTDGQTRKIARFCADRLADAGHGVELLSAAEAPGVVLSRFDGAVLAGSLHLGGFQKPLEVFAHTEAAALTAMPSLFLTVSLSAAGADVEDWDGLRGAVEAFGAQTGWIPGKVLYVAGAFRFSEYDWVRAWVMRRIAREKGETIDHGHDREYTDWEALGTALDTWVAGLSFARV